MINFCASTILSSWLADCEKMRNDKSGLWQYIKIINSNGILGTSQDHVLYGPTKKPTHLTKPWLDLRNLQVSWFEVSNKHTRTVWFRAATNYMSIYIYVYIHYRFSWSSLFDRISSAIKKLYHLYSPFLDSLAHLWLFCSSVRSRAVLLGVLNGRHVCGIDGIVPASQILIQILSANWFHRLS